MSIKIKIANTSCNNCGKVFYIKPSHLKRGWGKYCSRQCLAKGQLKGKFVFCDQCGERIWRAPKQLKHSKSGKFFCSKKCQTLWRNKVYSGENHPLWKGGYDKYRTILLSTNKPRVCVECGYKDERVLIVHHKDHNRKNKNIDNLEWLCRNCHYVIHKFKTV